MDRQGNGVEIQRERLPKCSEVPLGQFTDHMVRMHSGLRSCLLVPVPLCVLASLRPES